MLQKAGVVPSLVTIFFGANDAALPDRDSRRQHVPLSEYKENLQRMIVHLKVDHPLCCRMPAK